LIWWENCWSHQALVCSVCTLFINLNVNYKKLYSVRVSVTRCENS
jgi:hypothetical protein